MTHNNEQSVRVEPETKRLSESEIKRGAQVMSTQMADDYTPPSGSLNPAATVEPQTTGGSSSGDNSSGSTNSPTE